MPIQRIPSDKVSADPAITVQGSFLSGTPAIFFYTFADIDGELFDPSDIEILILDPLGATAKTGTAADKLEFGHYAFQWDIPSTAISGLYSLKTTYTHEMSSGATTTTVTENFVIGESENVTAVSVQTIAFRSFVESLIGYTQRIPVFHEIGRLNNAKKIAEFTFSRWNQPSGVRVFLNGDLKESGFTVDYVKGKVEFDTPLATIDEVTSSYTFRWFEDDEIDDFVRQATEFFNQYPPHSGYNITSLPTRYGVTIAHQAAVFALRRLIMDLHFQEPAKVFGGMDRADKLTGSLDSLKKNMEEDLNKLYEQKKYQPYLGLTKTITVPEFTLPGGRCMAEKSLIIYKKTSILSHQEISADLNVYTKYENKVNSWHSESPFVYTNVINSVDYHTGTIKEVYDLFDKGDSIEVLSDKDGILSFEPVSHIWDSGTKSLLRIEDEYDNVVEVSDEHIMFVNDKEIPALQVKVGDILTVNLFDSLQQSRVTKITRIKETPTFDIEVPTTENLMVNNIKCHNSRWFRYLFKGA